MQEVLAQASLTDVVTGHHHRAQPSLWIDLHDNDEFTTRRIGWSWLAANPDPTTGYLWVECGQTVVCSSAIWYCPINGHICDETVHEQAVIGFQGIC